MPAKAVTSLCFGGADLRDLYVVSADNTDDPARKGSIRFLQVTVELMSRDEHVIAALKTHMPVIRNNLLMLLGGQAIGSLTNREDKEKIRAQALAEVRKIVKENPPEDEDDEEHPGTVEDLYFTSFVVQ